MIDIDKDFSKLFPGLGYSLKDFQKKAISNVIDKGNTLCILPTGGGKSVIYWMSALELGGITIVISPLTALIEEQAKKIEEQGYEVLKLHGGINSLKQMKTLTKFANGEIDPRFIFLSPEKLATDGYLEACLKKRKADIKLFVIDEVHCVSQWGISFRPFYRRIPVFMDNLFGAGGRCKLLALTATLNNKEIDDICRYFNISKDNIIMNNVMMRNNIQLNVSKFNNEQEKTEKLWQLIHNHQDEKVLVYVYRKRHSKSVEAFCDEALKRGFSSAAFHGDMSAEMRTEIIERFRSGEVNIVFATNAFGMGIDIPDIRTIIHYMIPESIEQYYQEIGRASRDGCGANAYLLYSNKNVDVKSEYFIDGAFPDEKKLRRVYAKVAIQTGYVLMSYFDDDEIQDCLSYYIDSGLVKIVCKGFSALSFLSSITDPELQALYDSTKNKGIILTAKKNGISPAEVAEKTYSSLINGTAKAKKAPERWLILEVYNIEIDDETMERIKKDIDEKKAYKHELLDYFTYVLENCSDSLQLHQEIAAYLGTKKHDLKRIYTTKDGTLVRSKSEVIISNLLSAAGITYEYEKKLYYAENKWIEPDFTITLADGMQIYWEHLGMMGREEYDARWAEKIDIYKNYFPGRMVRTYESGNLSGDASKLIEKLTSADNQNDK